MSKKKDRAESTRKQFEEVVYRQYFNSTIQKDLSLKNTVDKATFLKRDEKGDYEDVHISAMWFGWRLRLASEAG